MENNADTRGTEEDTGTMTDRENRWYIVRDMGLVFNQEFLEEVDRAIIEELTSKQ